MKYIGRRPAMVAAASLWILSAAPLEATVVYVTYTGTISSGNDPGGVFGQAGSLSGKSFEVTALTDCGHRRRNSDYGISPRLAPPAKLRGLFKKKSLLPVAASAYWSLTTVIAARMVADAPED